jgi:hypothetical protein
MVQDHGQGLQAPDDGSTRDTKRRRSARCVAGATPVFGAVAPIAPSVAPFTGNVVPLWRYDQFDVSTIEEAAGELRSALQVDLWSNLNADGRAPAVYIRASPFGTVPRITASNATAITAARSLGALASTGNESSGPLISTKEGGGALIANADQEVAGARIVDQEVAVAVSVKFLQFPYITFDEETSRALNRAFTLPGACYTSTPSEAVSREHDVRASIVLFVAVCLHHRRPGGDFGTFPGTSGTSKGKYASSDAIRCIVHSLLGRGLESVLRSPCIDFSGLEPMNPLQFALWHADIGVNALVALELLRLPESVFGSFDVDSPSRYWYSTPQYGLSVVISRSSSSGVRAPYDMIASPHVCALVDMLCRRTRSDAAFNVQFAAEDLDRTPTRLRETLLFSCVEKAASYSDPLTKEMMNTLVHACALTHILLRYAADDGSGVNVLWRTAPDTRVNYFVGNGVEDDISNFTALQLLNARMGDWNVPRKAKTQYDELTPDERQAVRLKLEAVRAALVTAESRSERHRRELLPMLMRTMSADRSPKPEPFPRVLAGLVSFYTIVDH